MKVNPRSYKGIEFVELRTLPQEQQEKLLETIDPKIFIKIMINGEIISQCIQYKDYSRWYRDVFKPAQVVSKEQVIPGSIGLNSKLVLNKNLIPNS